MNEVFVTCRFMGGIGNQMFQAAHVIAQSKKNQVEPIFYPKSYIPLQGNQTVKYIDNIFKNLRFSETIRPKKLIKSPSWSFVVINDKITDSTVFDGYFQSDKNFYGYDDEIRNIFKPDKKTVESIKQKYPELNNDVTAIHVRRGDYLKFKDVHPCITKEYIDKGIDIINNGNPIFVFTDDKKWCEENLDFNYTLVNEEDYMEIWIMSLCKDFIMSNSSFSWWGSFLSEKGGKVIAPSKWFGPKGEKNFNDIYRKNFIVI